MAPSVVGPLGLPNEATAHGLTGEDRGLDLAARGRLALGTVVEKIVMFGERLTGLLNVKCPLVFTAVAGRTHRSFLCGWAGLSCRRRAAVHLRRREPGLIARAAEAKGTDGPVAKELVASTKPACYSPLQFRHCR